MRVTLCGVRGSTPAPGPEFVRIGGHTSCVALAHDGEPLAELGPGAVLGERALLEGGTRTSTLRAATRCKVALAAGDQLDRATLAELSTGHRREDQPRDR